MGFRVRECVLGLAVCLGLSGCFNEESASGSGAPSNNPPAGTSTDTSTSNPAPAPAPGNPESGSSNASSAPAGGQGSALEFVYTPATSVAVGVRYGYRAVARGGSGGALTWSIANKPAWAFFDTTTGDLIGIPEVRHVGAWNNIVITVSDGSRSRSLETFGITVNQVAVNGTAALSWTPPYENEDGSPLTNLAGYRIYGGNSPGDLSLIRTISNPGITTAVIQDLAAGTVYFAISAFTASGQESDRTPLGSKTIG